MGFVRVRTFPGPVPTTARPVLVTGDGGDAQIYSNGHTLDPYAIDPYAIFAVESVQYARFSLEEENKAVYIQAMNGVQFITAGIFRATWDPPSAYSALYPFDTTSYNGDGNPGGGAKIWAMYPFIILTGLPIGEYYIAFQTYANGSSWSGNFAWTGVQLIVHIGDLGLGVPTPS